MGWPSRGVPHALHVAARCVPQPGLLDAVRHEGKRRRLTSAPQKKKDKKRKKNLRFCYDASDPCLARAHSMPSSEPCKLLSLKPSHFHPTHKNAAPRGSRGSSSPARLLPCSPQNFLPGPLLEPAFKQAASSGGHQHESARCEHGVSPGHRHGKAPVHKTLSPSTKQHPKHHPSTRPVPPAKKAQLQPEQRGTSQVWPGGLILSHEKHAELAQRQKTVLMTTSENTTQRFREKHHRCTKRKLLRKKPAQAWRKRVCLPLWGTKKGCRKALHSSSLVPNPKASAGHGESVSSPGTAQERHRRPREAGLGAEQLQQ